MSCGIRLVCSPLPSLVEYVYSCKEEVAESTTKHFLARCADTSSVGVCVWVVLNGWGFQFPVMSERLGDIVSLLF